MSVQRRSPASSGLRQPLLVLHQHFLKVQTSFICVIEGTTIIKKSVLSVQAGEGGQGVIQLQKRKSGVKNVWALSAAATLTHFILVGERGQCLLAMTIDHLKSVFVIDVHQKKVSIPVIVLFICKWLAPLSLSKCHLLNYPSPLFLENIFLITRNLSIECRSIKQN